MNVTQTTNAIVESYEARQPLMLWGAPGIGKSASTGAARTILQERYYPAKEMKKLKEKATFGLIDLRLSLLDQIDLRGAPFPNRERRILEWFQPAFLPTSGRGIIFLDEIVQAVPSMQACASQLVLDRRIGEYVLPEGWMVMAAGNRVSDRSAANAMPKHLANRFVHLYVEVDVDSWIEWALQAGIDLRVIAFIKWRRPLLHVFDPQNKGEAFASPRSWEFVSKLITGKDKATQLLDTMINGAVGDGPGGEFSAFLRIYEKMPNIDSFFLNPDKAPIPTEMSVLYAVTTGMIHRATPDNMGAIAKFFNRVTDAGKPDFSVYALKEVDAKDAKNTGKKLTQTRAYIEWASKHNHILV